MQKRWVILNELIFTIQRDRNTGRTVRVLVDNADERDKAFLSAVADLIGVWTKEVSPCPKPKRKA